MDEKLKNVTLLYMTCDTFSDLWNNSFLLLDRYMGIDELDVVFNTESKDFQYSGGIYNGLGCSCNTPWSN